MASVLTEKIKNVIVGSVFILTLFLILFHFTDTPRVWVDEGVFTEVARNLAVHGTLSIQTAPGQFFSMRSFLLSTSYPVIFPVAVSLKIFGIGLWQARLPMVIYMFLLVLFFYLFAKKKYGFWPAILSVLLLISFSPFYGNGRPVQGEVPGLVFLTFGGWLGLLWEKSDFKNKKESFFTGLAFGLSASVKPIFLAGVSLSLFLGCVVWAKKIWIGDRDDIEIGNSGEQKKSRTAFWMLIFGYSIPVSIWGVIHFPTIHSVIVFVPTYLFFAGNHGSSLSLFQTITLNLGRFVKESTPLLFLLLFVSVLVSFVFRWVQKKENTQKSASNFLTVFTMQFSFSECIILFFVVLNWCAYLIGTGWYRYFFPAHVLLYLLFPGAVFVAIKCARTSLMRKCIGVVAITLVLFQFYYLIYLSDTSLVISRTRNATLSSNLLSLDSHKKVFFYNTIDALVFFKGENYSQYLNMAGFLVVGDTNRVQREHPDYIFADNDVATSTFSCYIKIIQDKYSLYEKIAGCKDK